MLYEIKVELKEIKPAIWRILRVRPQTSLSRLHKVLQKAMGWTNSHLHLFEIDGQVYSEGGIDWESDIQDYQGMRLDKIFTEGRTSFLYEYDPGDSWRHDITLLGAVEGEPEEKIACIGGPGPALLKTAAVPQDTMTYWWLLSDPDHEEHDAMLDWVGGKYDPNAFNIAAVDRALKRLR